MAFSKYPPSHIGTESISNGFSEIYRCISCRAVIEIPQQMVKKLRKKKSKLNAQGFHAEEYCCSKKCAEKKGAELVKVHGFPLFAVIFFKRPGAFGAVVNTPAFDFKRSNEDNYLLLKFECCGKDCGRKFEYLAHTVTAMRKQKPALSAKGIHWREMFCGEACIEEAKTSELRKLGFTKMPETEVSSWVYSAAKTNEEMRFKSEAIERGSKDRIVSNFISKDWKGRIVSMEVQKAAKWLLDNRSKIHEVETLKALIVRNLI